MHPFSTPPPLKASGGSEMVHSGQMGLVINDPQPQKSSENHRFADDFRGIEVN